MRESLWPVKLLFFGALAVGVVFLFAIAWLVAISPLPDWIKFVLFSLLSGSGLLGGNEARRRYRDGRNPWSRKTPERG
jgi:hypothetical protein